ncbi:DUF4232 domain-containing protein [Phaeacidiphilus oryzae]|uniref:DUF4232 domain-containing protein n=1 Tax=Phaeacidiphilus oryzae TaxID=348818 RepID=UPI00055B1B9C|nr:DUF4232 domain-containing protein [Phaeacidiphilus oryzae]
MHPLASKVAVLALAASAALPLTACDVLGSGTMAGGAGQGTRPVPAGACRTSDLAFSKSAGQSADTLRIDLKNTGTGGCWLRGTLKALLEGPGDEEQAASTQVGRPTRLTLRPGGSTGFLVRFKQSTSGDAWTFTSLLIYPPHETTPSPALAVTVHGDPNDPSTITITPTGPNSSRP